MNYPRVFLKYEEIEDVEARWGNLDEKENLNKFVQWCVENFADEIMVILDRDDDDENANVIEIWIDGSLESRTEIARKEYWKHMEEDPP